MPRSRPYPRYRRVCFLGACPSRSHAIRDPLGSPGLQSPFPGRDLYRTGAEVQAIQPSPCHPGLAVPAPQRFQGSTAFRTCCCPLQVSPSGRSGDPKVSRSTFPVLHGDQRRRYSAHRGRSAEADCSAWSTSIRLPTPFLPLFSLHPVTHTWALPAPVCGDPFIRNICVLAATFPVLLLVFRGHFIKKHSA